MDSRRTPAELASFVEARSAEPVATQPATEPVATEPAVAPRAALSAMFAHPPRELAAAQINGQKALDAALTGPGGFAAALAALRMPPVDAVGSRDTLGVLAQVDALKASWSSVHVGNTTLAAQPVAPVAPAAPAPRAALSALSALSAQHHRRSLADMARAVESAADASRRRLGELARQPRPRPPASPPKAPTGPDRPIATLIGRGHKAREPLAWATPPLEQSPPSHADVELLAYRKPRMPRIPREHAPRDPSARQVPEWADKCGEHILPPAIRMEPVPEARLKAVVEARPENVYIPTTRVMQSEAADGPMDSRAMADLVKLHQHTLDRPLLPPPSMEEMERWQAEQRAREDRVTKAWGHRRAEEQIESAQAHHRLGEGFYRSENVIAFDAWDGGVHLGPGRLANGAAWAIDREGTVRSPRSPAVSPTVSPARSRASSPSPPWSPPPEEPASIRRPWSPGPERTRPVEWIGFLNDDPAELAEEARLASEEAAREATEAQAAADAVSRAEAVADAAEAKADVAEAKAEVAEAKADAATEAKADSADAADSADDTVLVETPVEAADVSRAMLNPIDTSAPATTQPTGAAGEQCVTM